MTPATSPRIVNDPEGFRWLIETIRSIGLVELAGDPSNPPDDAITLMQAILASLNAGMPSLPLEVMVSTLVFMLTHYYGTDIEVGIGDCPADGTPCVTIRPAEHVSPSVTIH